MKILVYSDNHFCQYSSILRSRGKKFSKRLENGIQSVNFVESEANRLGCQQIVCCGDFFDKPVLNAEELSALNEITWANLPHIFLVGNHELGNNDLSFNSVNALSKFGFTIVNAPSVQVVGDAELCYLPYQLDSSDHTINDYFPPNSLQKRIVFSHNDIAGVQMGKFKSTSGFDTKDIENSCDYFINGHIHNSAWISTNILDIGNLTGMNFSEDAFKYMHLYAVVDTDRLTVEVYNNPYAIRFGHIDESNIDRFWKLKDDADTIVQNLVLSIKVVRDDVERVREYANGLGLLTYKIIGIASNNGDTAVVSEIEHVDHIQQFINYFVERYGSDPLIDDELSRVTR